MSELSHTVDEYTFVCRLLKDYEKTEVLVYQKDILVSRISWDTGEIVKLSSTRNENGNYKFVAFGPLESYEKGIIFGVTVLESAAEFLHDAISKFEHEYLQEDK
ncbi:MAG: hypothetical protein ACXABY_07810 [Candidatus Thorarchaeota archaeon]|jgi:hypothetical protein